MGKGILVGRSEQQSPVRHKTIILFIFIVVLGGLHSTQAELNSDTQDDPNQPSDRQQYPNLESFQTVYQPYLKNLSAYQPAYFLVGTNPRDSKFQFSLKYQLFGKNSAWSQTQPWLTGCHFGYTQTSFWDLKSDSKPFDDSSYKPELFYLTRNLEPDVPWLRGFFIRSGIQHESNGRGGVDSRSTNFLYAKPLFIFFGEEHKLGLSVSPKVWLYFGNDNETNADLKDYRGYFDLEIKCGHAQGLVFSTNLTWARRGGSGTFDLTYPLHKLFKGYLDMYIQVQYVDALAEVLKTYQHRNRTWRIGLAIVR